MTRDTRYAAVSILALSVLMVFIFSGHGPLKSLLYKNPYLPPLPDASNVPALPGIEVSGLFQDKSNAGLSSGTQEAVRMPLPVFPIDLNRASVEALELLPGVGRKTAQRIIDKRAEKGGFRSIEDLAEVKYIGRHKLEKIRPFVVVKTPQTLKNR